MFCVGPDPVAPALGLRPEALEAVVAGAAAQMHDVPFHNFRHVFTVALTAWRLLAASAELRGRMPDLDRAALLLGGLLHDLDHPGTTNNWQCATLTPLARRYNDKRRAPARLPPRRPPEAGRRPRALRACSARSVLENHHSALAWELLDSSSLLEPLSRAQQGALRTLLVEAILQTDMAHHKAMLERLAAWQPPEGAPLGAGTMEDRVLLLSAALHCADLHSPLMEPELDVRLADCIAAEFEAQAGFRWPGFLGGFSARRRRLPLPPPQAALERASGLPVTVINASTPLAKATMEIGFISFVASPAAPPGRVDPPGRGLTAAAAGWAPQGSAPARSRPGCSRAQPSARRTAPRRR